MNFWAIIKMLFTYGPAVWGIVKDIISLINKLNGDDKLEALTELKVATAVHKSEKTKEPLLTLRDRLRARRQQRGTHT